MAEKLAQQDLVAPHWVGQEQEHRPPFRLADDRVVGEKKGDERDEIDAQAREADDGDRQPIGADRADRRAAEEGKRQGKAAEQQRRRGDPAVAQAVANLLSGDEKNRPHGLGPTAVK